MTLIICDLKLKCRELSTFAFSGNVPRDVSVHMYMYTKIADRTLSFPLIVVYQEDRNFAERDVHLHDDCKPPPHPIHLVSLKEITSSDKSDATFLYIYCCRRGMGELCR